MRFKVPTGAILLTLGVVAGAGAEGPMPVSPGGHSGMAVTAGSCPTFLWTYVEGAESVDLVAYRLPGKEPDAPPQQVLSVTLPGNAHGWTPSLGQCLEPGGRYAWSVRAAGASGGSEWSEASLFEVAARPSLEEVTEAIALLRRFVGEEESAASLEDGRYRDRETAVDA